MPQSLTNLLYHIIYSTKNREPTIDDTVEGKLHAYLAGICSKVGGKPININGMPDHVHILTYLPPTVMVSNVIRDLKACSSRWLHETFDHQRGFAWQAGYGAFSVSPSKLVEVRNYIAKQKEHHRDLSFQDEYRAFLWKHGIEFDERYVWD